jgi:uncharacterized RDD family membrane protein YckC
VNAWTSLIRRSCVVLIDFDLESRHRLELVQRTLTPEGYETFVADRPRDEAGPQGTILKQIIKLIAQCDLVIADISRRNPNVMFELGIALTLRRKVLIIGNSDTPIPFDIAGYRRFAVPAGDVWPELASAARLLDRQPAGSDAVAEALDFYGIRIGERMFLRRLMSAYIDALVVFAPLVVVLQLQTMATMSPYTMLLLMLGPMIGYLFLCTWLFQSSLGKVITRLKVTDLRGDPPSALASLGRALSAVLMVQTIGIGLLVCLAGPSYRTLDDLLSRTMVRKIHRRAPIPDAS